MNESPLQEHAVTISTESIQFAFGNQLSCMRTQAGISSGQLALLAGISLSSLHLLEMGYGDADLPLLSRLSSVLRISLSELLQGL